MRKFIIISILIALPFALNAANEKTPEAYSSYSLVKLKISKSFASQVVKGHAIYEIYNHFDLKGQTVVIPCDCILDFKGGSISNGKIVFDGTVVNSLYPDVFSNVNIEGMLANNEVRLSWWSLAYDESTNDGILINQIIKATDNAILYYDIQQDVYVGGEKGSAQPEESVAFLNKKNLRVIQTTDHYTILRGRSATGSVIRCNFNKFVSIDGLKVDGNNVYYGKTGENGIGVVGNEKVVIENCVIKNCFSNCFDERANGTLLKSGYPEWGSGGKGIQVEGGDISIQATIRNNSIYNSYIGISNNAPDQENVVMDGNYIENCYMSMILLRLSASKRMNVNISNTIIADNSGNEGVICMGNVANVNMSNIQIKGSKKVKSVLRGCFSYSNIQIIVNQPCNYLIDAALFRDNPEGQYAMHNYVKIISDQTCDNIINTSSSVIPKKNGSTYAEYVGGEFDITLSGKVAKTPIVLRAQNNTSNFRVKMGGVVKSGIAQTINR